MRTVIRLRNLMRVAALAGALALTAAACGDDGGSPGAVPSPDDTQPTTAPADDTGSGNDAEPSDRSVELLGAWTITTFQLAGGLGEADVVGSEPATIEFSDDGTFTFSTGCNTGEGEWDPFGVYQPENDDGIPVGQSISFGGLSRTEIACADELADQDLAIGGAIRATDVFTLDGSTLTLWRDGNLMIGATR